MPVNNSRSQFSIFNDTIYLNTCSLGAQSSRHRKYIEEYLDLWNRLGASAWYQHWLGELENIRSLFAQVINADHSEIALGHSVSTVLAVISSAIDTTERKNFVVTDLDFPTANYQWMTKPDTSTTIIKSSNSISVDMTEFLGAIDKNCAAVSTSHVFFTSGHIQDIKRICDASRENSTLSIIDAYQSVGQVAVDVRDIKPDFLISGGLKWLLGGSGITFVYANRETTKNLLPTSPGWFGVKDQFKFNQSSFELHNDARKFEAGTPSVPAIYTAKAGLEIILETGLKTIQQRTTDLTEELIHSLQKSGFDLQISPEEQNRSAIVMIRYTNPGPVVKELARRKIIVDYRNDLIRVSPYFYNTSEDIQTFVKMLKDIT